MNAKIEKAIKRLGLNKTVLAKRTGLSLSTINKILDDGTIDQCRVGNAKKIAKELCCSLDDIVYGMESDKDILFNEDFTSNRVVRYCNARGITISELEFEINEKIKKINEVALLLRDVPTFIEMANETNRRISKKISDLNGIMYARKENDSVDARRMKQ